ncbi:MAG: TrpB-like pyridoxal phosphate-dependent enzyme [Candidatus Brocadiia bacterium]
MEQIKINLEEQHFPEHWYNIAADLSETPRPPLTADGTPITPETLAPVFPMNLIEQEMSTERWIAIPDEVRDILLRWRPSPLRRAVYLERHLDTPARIYYKDESVSPPGSHKPNTSVAQAWYNKQFGIDKLTTETGAGQWGSALGFACQLVGLECKVYMVRCSYEQKPFRKIMMQVWDADCIPSPSEQTQAGRDVLEETPDTTGSLGIAISEAVEEAVADESGSTRYALGSVLNHVMLHQTVIGLEAKHQLEIAGEGLPDVLVGCCGGGSNFAGLTFPFLREKMNGAEMKVIPVEPTACPTMTRGEFAYDFGDRAHSTPLLPMHSLGHAFVPPGIHAGGLRYHGMAPLVSQTIREGLVSPLALNQLECYRSALTWAQTEGSICAPETSHAIAATIREAEKAREQGEEKVIVMCYSGHGMLDLSAYESYLAGELEDSTLPEDELEKSLRVLNNHPQPE